MHGGPQLACFRTNPFELAFVDTVIHGSDRLCVLALVGQKPVLNPPQCFRSAAYAAEHFPGDREPRLELC